jgi:hypothetical protein
MSQRYLIPTNLFYHWRDPWPPEFPAPNTGDTYFNVSSQTIRVFYEGEWHDASGGSSGGGTEEIAVQDAEPTLSTLDLWVNTSASGSLANHGDLAGLEEDSHPQYLTTGRADEQYVRTVKLIVSDDPASGTPIGGAGTVWIEW